MARETCPFPKHRDRPWSDVLEDDRPYLEWLVSGEGPDMDEGLYDLITDLLEET